jgi:hypothetical protein
MPTKSKALAIAALSDALSKKDTGYIANLLAQVDADILQTQKQGNNVETRKAAIRKALADANKKAVADHLKAFKNVPAQAQAIAAFAPEAAERGLDEDEAVVVMRQVLDIKLAKEMADAAYEAAKALVFGSMNLAFAEDGEEFPEHTNGVIDVPELGKRFCREGAGRKDANIDLAALAELVGEEVFAKITAEKVTVTRVIDEDALAAAVNETPELLEQVRAAVKPGDWKTPRLWVRDIPASEIEQE